ncbi:retron system putative HNH endonuclease [Neptunomonas sp.]|uniref:retron system putative HNH endonuclease n=1 Tax=Neptunomonas sp. TaxID=1971898 RepID=UPI003564BF22
MKAIVKGVEPPKLLTYRTSCSTRTWEQFTSKDKRKKETQRQLVSDQGGICAYCEVDLKTAPKHRVADLRVEHFHPKSDKSSGHNWNLDWQNLLACCHGGSQKNVVDSADRFSSPDHSCDVPKGKKILDHVILNPICIPAYPCLFKIERSSGGISVHNENCDSAGVNVQKAQATIDELRLDSERLRRMRKGELNRINEQLRDRVANGETVDEAREYLAKALLRKDSNSLWPKFFTSIRSYLGSSAETQLRAINYIE